MGPAMNSTLETDRHRVLRASAAFSTRDNGLPGQPALGLCNRAHMPRELRPYGRARGVVRPGLPDQRQRISPFSAVPQRHPLPYELTLLCDTELVDHLADAVVTIGGHRCSVGVLHESHCTKEHTRCLRPLQQPDCDDRQRHFARTLRSADGAIHGNAVPRSNPGSCCRDWIDRCTTAAWMRRPTSR